MKNTTMKFTYEIILSTGRAGWSLKAGLNYMLNF